MERYGYFIIYNILISFNLNWKNAITCIRPHKMLTGNACSTSNTGLSIPTSKRHSCMDASSIYAYGQQERFVKEGEKRVDYNHLAYYTAKCGGRSAHVHWTRKVVISLPPIINRGAWALILCGVHRQSCCLLYNMMQQFSATVTLVMKLTFQSMMVCWTVHQLCPRY